MKVLMIGVDSSTQGGMWSVVEGYLKCQKFCEKTNLFYIPTSVTGNTLRKLVFTAKAYIKILLTLITTDIDVVHIHVSERGSVYRKYIVLKMAKLFHCKVVLHMHGAEFQTWYEHLSTRKQGQIKTIFGQADQILILGNYWKEFVSTIVDDKKIEVLYNAVEIPSKPLYRAEAKNLLFMGVVGKRKGIDDLLAAMVKADEKLEKDVQLLVYGPNPEGDIERKINQYRLSHRVQYKGWLKNEQKESVFLETAVHVLPSYNEGLPMAVLETMAYGIPNISTAVAAIPEAVNSRNGVLIAPGDIERLADNLVRLMNNRSERVEKSMATYEEMHEKFSFDSHIKKLLGVYERLESDK